MAQRAADVCNRNDQQELFNVFDVFYSDGFPSASTFLKSFSKHFAVVCTFFF